MLEDLVVPKVEAMLITLIRIVPIGIRQVGSDTGTLAMFCWDGPTTPDMEVVVELIGSLSC